MPRIGAQLKNSTAALAKPWRVARACVVCVLINAGQVAAQRPVDANSAITLPPPTSVAEEKHGSSIEAESPASAIDLLNTTEKTAGPAMVVPPATGALQGARGGRGAESSGRAPLGVMPTRAASTGETEETRQRSTAIGSTGLNFTRVLGALAAVIGLILLLRTLAVRFLPTTLGGGGGVGGRPSGVIEVLARYPVGRGQQLMVLKFARRILLVHQSGAIARTLSEMTDPDEVAATLSRLEAGATVANAAKFRSAIQSFEQEHEAAMRERTRPEASSPAMETEIIDLTRTRILGKSSNFASRRMLR